MDPLVAMRGLPPVVTRALLPGLVLLSLLLPGQPAATAQTPGQQTAWSLWRDLSRAHRCNAIRLMLGPAISCPEVDPPASTGTLLADALELAYGVNNPPAASVRERHLRRQRHCQSMIGAAVARYVGLGLVLQEGGLPRERAERLVGRMLNPVESYCRVEVRESRRGVILPSVGEQCASAVGEPGDDVDAKALRGCLERLLSYWVNRSSSSPEPLRPNIVLIVTDDQRWDTLDATHSPDGVPVMPTVLDRLASDGMEFKEAFVTTPVCAPSRASILTGQYAHTNGVIRNQGIGGGAPALDDSSTLATWLQDAGYRTGFFGKYLNGYAELWDSSIAPPYVPPGWDDWRAFNISYPGGEMYFDYSLIENGNVVAYGDDEDNYSTDVLSRQLLSFIDVSVEQGDPFFVAHNPSAPHHPYTPAPRHMGSFSALPLWLPPSYFEFDVSDKPGWVRRLPVVAWRINRGIRMRIRQLEMLQAVDESVDALIDKLREHGIENNTIVMFLSDNGMSWGEHRHLAKCCGYEECLRVPLVVRYPRLVPLARQSSTMALNIDIAPTVAELAGATLPPGRDGRSLVRVLDGTDRSPIHDFVFENCNERRWCFAGVREAEWKYVEYLNGDRELYNLFNDPYELENIAYAPENIERVEQMRLRSLDFMPSWPE